MYVCVYVRMYLCTYVCMYVCMYACMHVCPRCCIQWIALQACSLCTPVFQIVSETHSNITSNTDKIHGKHFHNHFPALSFTTFSPFPLFFHYFFIPFLNFAFCPNSVSKGNWEHVGLSGPIILKRNNSMVSYQKFFACVEIRHSSCSKSKGLFPLKQNRP